MALKEDIAPASDRARESLFKASPLIVCGMPHSGASVVGQAFAEAGLYLGDTFDTSDFFSASGYLADQDMVRFHQHLLDINQASWKDVETMKNLTVSGDDKKQARALLVRKFGDRTLWG